MDCGDVYVNSMYLNNKDGKIYFYNLPGIRETGEPTGPNEFSVAEDENGKLVNVSKLKGFEDISYVYGIRDGKLIYGEHDSHILKQCDIEEGISSEKVIANFEIKQDEGVAYQGLIGDEMIGQWLLRTEGFGSETWEDYYIISLSGEIKNKLDFNIDGSVSFSVSESGEKIYFSSTVGQIYKASVASLKVKVDSDEISEMVAKLKGFQTDQPEAERYVDGDKSYDEFDTSDFKFAARNKSGMDEKSGVYYEIFVRSFADSNGDGIGDFNGITEKLDYLKDLGISGIYLMPINSSPSYHGYDITDYNALNSDYGTEEDFKKLIEEAHKRNISVIMDFVINHTSSEHPWFEDALLNEDSEYRNYYRFVAGNDTKDFSMSDTSPWDSMVWNQTPDGDYYYSIFVSSMPDLNYNNPDVRKEIKESAGKWLNLGVDGFRMDAAMHIYGVNEFKQQKDNTESNLQWWNEFATYCETINPKVYLVGEIWDNEEVHSEYAQPFDTKFDFTFETNMISAVQSEKAVLSDGKNLSKLMEELIAAYNSVDEDFINGVFGTNHDQNRIMSEVNNAEQAKVVANIYLTLPGNPFLYYGEELGMEGEKPDEMLRTPFKWSKNGSGNTTWEIDEANANLAPFDEQKNDDNSMYNYYKKLITLRNSNASLSKGSYKAVDTGNEAIMAYIREYEGEKVMVIHNLSGTKQDINLSDYSFGEVLLSQRSGSTVNGNSIAIEKISSLILKIK